MLPPARILSLASATARRAETRAEMARVGVAFAFVDAPVGADLPASALAPSARAAGRPGGNKRPLTAGEVACALGHRAIWGAVAAGPDPLALVLEDDLAWLADPLPLLTAAFARAKDLEGTMVKLDGAAKGGEEVARLGASGLILSPRPPARTTGYLIGRAAARALLAATEGPVILPVDMLLRRHWLHGVPVLATRPVLVGERPGTVSSLSPARDGAGGQGRLARLAANLRYQWDMWQGRRRHPLRAADLPALAPLLERSH